MGFINLSSDNPMLEILEQQGLQRQELVPRWTLYRSDAPDGDTYLAGMRSSVRRDYQRQLRRYRERAHARVHGAQHRGLIRLLELIAMSAARTGSPRYYDPLRLAVFLQELGEPVQVVEVRENGGEPLAVAVCFREASRLQAWAGGYVRGRTDLSFSPYYALWWEIANPHVVDRCRFDRMRAAQRDLQGEDAPDSAELGGDDRFTKENGTRRK